MMFSIATLGEAEARRQAWSYFRAAFHANYNPKTRVGAKGLSLRGPMLLGGDGKFYHGQEETHAFTVWVHCKDGELGVRVKIVTWDPQRETFESPEEYCGNFSFSRGLRGSLNRVYCCNGHEAGPADEAGLPLCHHRCPRLGCPRRSECLRR
jgi:hypothetical protein